MTLLIILRPKSQLKAGTHAQRGLARLECEQVAARPRELDSVGKLKKLVYLALTARGT